MGSITTGIGLISGIDTANLIESLIALESTPKFRLESRVTELQAQRTALLDINARLLNFKSAAHTFRFDRIFQNALARSSNEDILTATATNSAQAGSYQFRVKQLVSTSQVMTRGFADRDVSGAGLNTLSFELGNGRLENNVDLSELNGGTGIGRGEIVITDKSGASAVIDLTDVTSINEVIDRINSESSVRVSAQAANNALVITDTSGGGGMLTIANAPGDTTATDLGIAGSTAGTELTGSSIYALAGNTALSSLNDGRGVLIRNNVPDLNITARDGTHFAIDLGSIRADIDDNTKLSDLNTGAGISINDSTDDPDIKFVDRDGTEHEVDLTGVTTVGGLKARVATETSGRISIDITDGDKLTVTDSNPGGGTLNLKVIGAGPDGNETAQDLGILNVAGVAADSLTGNVVPNTVTNPPAQTIDDVIERINEALDATEIANGGRIVASLAADGVSLQIDDTTGGGGNLIIRSSTASPLAAQHLGIETDVAGVAANTIDGQRVIAGLNTVLISSLNGGAGLQQPAGAPATLTGATLLDDLFQGQGLSTNGAAADIQVQDRDGNTYDIDLDGVSTVQDLIDAFDAQTGGTVTLAINGQALEATHNGLGVLNFKISDINGAQAATELGIVVDNSIVQGDTVTGNDTQPLAPPVTATTLTITDRSGASLTLNNLNTFETLDDLLTAIDAEAVSNGVSISIGLNDSGNGLKITDTSGGGGKLQITGDGADAMGIAADVAANEVNGSNLQRRYVDEATNLDDLNFGRGIGLGSFRLIDGFGNRTDVSIDSDTATVYDVIQEINSRGLALKARVNDTGDGIVLEEDLAGQTNEPFVTFKVETVNGTTAADLRLLGNADNITGGVIDGSYEINIDVDPADTLNEIRDKINGSGAPISATIINSGAGANPYHLTITSGIAGSAGDLAVDSGGVDLRLKTLQRGEDAKMFFGSADPRDAFIITSSSNTFENIADGVTIEAVKADEELITLTVERDDESIVTAVSQFVTTFNDAIGRINEYDFFDTETEQRGVLLGNSTTGRIREALYRTLRQPAIGVSTPLRFLSQAGIKVGSDGELEFDQAKFNELLDSDPEALSNLFAAFESSTDTETEIAPGVTVIESSTSATVQGLGDIFDELLDDLTNSINGTITLASDAFQDQIDLNNDRIEDFEERLQSRRERLQREFTAMEVALSRLQGQSNSLISLQSNLAALTTSRR